MKNSLWEAYLSPTPKNVKKWLLAVKGILGSAAIGEYFSGDPDVAFWLVVIIGIINEAAGLLTENTDENQNPS